MGHAQQTAQAFGDLLGPILTCAAFLGLEQHMSCAVLKPEFGFRAKLLGRDGAFPVYSEHWEHQRPLRVFRGLKTKSSWRFHKASHHHAVVSAGVPSGWRGGLAIDSAARNYNDDPI